MPWNVKCCLCHGGQTQENVEVAFHKFPTDAATREKWLALCGFAVRDQVKNLLICSQHFQPSMYRKFKSQFNLIPGSVPSRRELNSNSRDQLSSQINFDVPSTSGAERSGSIPHVDISPSGTEATETGGDDAKLLTLPSTPKARRYIDPRNVFDVRTPDVKTPRRASRVIAMIKKHAQKREDKIKQLQNANTYMKRKIQTLEDMINHLKSRNLLGERSGDDIIDLLPNSIRAMLTKHVQRKRHYTEELRCFALTLNFYSPRAYNYVRRIWKNLLPHPSTIRNWYRVVDALPGFTSEALTAIKLKVDSNAQCAKKTFVNLVIDDMSIREQLVYKNGRYYGGVEFGQMAYSTDEASTVPKATYACVFLVVGLNDHFKIPVGYFLINGLSAKERSALLLKGIDFINETGAILRSVTFDGAHTNVRMVKLLGANIDTTAKDYKPYFLHQNVKIYVFMDACHMLKLVRNTLGDKQILWRHNKPIKWEFFTKLSNLQKSEGLRIANKLTNKHIHYANHIMNVKLAAQTLSLSVSRALEYCKRKHIPEFENSEETAIFCKNFNDAFDMLNCKNKYAKLNFNIPINLDNLHKIKNFYNEFKIYVNDLQDAQKSSILHSSRHMGFNGMLISLNNAIALFEDLHYLGLNYLLTYKLSQDYIETFFSAIRARGGFNNNPNALQFQAAYKRLLLRMELKQFETGNILFDSVDILHVSSRKTHQDVDIPVDDDDDINIIDTHDYLRTIWTLSPIVEDIIEYISGYVAAKVKKHTDCQVCQSQLHSSEKIILIEIKKMSENFISPSRSVIKICKTAESVFRQFFDIYIRNVTNVLANKIFNKVNAFENNIMLNHIKEQDLLDNHKILLIKRIINLFLKIRLNYEGLKLSEKPITLRQKLSKIILFRNE